MGVIQKPLAEIYMHTSSGDKYYPFAPRPEHVQIEVIAHHLATRGRWAGATQHKVHKERIFYSVAEHSVYVSEFLEREMNRPDLAMAGLLHDGAEAYNGDLIRPLKYSAEFMLPFSKVEAINELAVAGRFGMDMSKAHHELIKVADNAVAAAEYQQIVPRKEEEIWSMDLITSKVIAKHEIKMLDPYPAKVLFLKRYNELLEDGA